MKRIIKFTILKVVEIAGVALVFWGLFWHGHWLCILLVSDYNPMNSLERWLFAPFFGVTIGLIFPFIACLVIYKWIKWNWEKAG